MTQDLALGASGIAFAVHDDAALVTAAKGNPEAFAELYRHYLPRVYRYLRTRALSSEEASDLTQTVFLKAFVALSRYRSDRTPFAAWLFRIARNTAVDSERRRRATVPWEFVPELLVPVDPDASPDVRAEQQERAAQLHDAVRRLDAGKRELLGLKYAAGLSNAEIAGVLGKSNAAVKKMMTRTLSALKEQYREEQS